jgi:hypothetical protein
VTIITDGQVEEGTLRGPPSSHDSNSLDFYLWRHLKALVDSVPVHTVDILDQQTVTIRKYPGNFERVRQSIRRAQAYIESHGRHFYHIL